MGQGDQGDYEQRVLWDTSERIQGILEVDFDLLQGFKCQKMDVY